LWHNSQGTGITCVD